MAELDDEDTLLRSVALQNANSIQKARQRAEEELLRTKDALRESQERLRAALNAAGTGTFRWNIQTNTVEWDGNIDRLFGLDPGRTTQSLDAFIAAVHPADRGGLITALEESARDGADFDMEFRVVWPDGSVHWIDDKAKAFFDQHGRPQYMTGACADVTSRRKAAEAVRANEERLRGIFNQAAIGIAVVELDGRFHDMNRKCSDVLGYEPHELRERTILEITHPDDRGATQTAMSKLLSGAIRDVSLEQRYIRSDRSVVWSCTSVTSQTDEAGRPLRLLAVIEDITSRKQAEAALREETRTLELLNETGRTLASKLDLAAVVQAVTDASTELSGAAFGAFLFATPSRESVPCFPSAVSGIARETFAAFARPRAADLVGPTLRGEPPVLDDDVLSDERHGTVGASDCGPGEEVTVRSFLAVPVWSRTGEVIGGLFFGHPQPGIFSARTERLVVGVAAQAGIAIDNARLYEAAQAAADERKTLLESERAARSAAERLSSLKDEFLATLSHELRTPLNAILGWAQVLRTGPKHGVDLAKGLETIERNARAQTQLIEDLLDMSRITAGKVRLDVQPIAPVTFIEAALETVRPAADARGIRLETVLDPSAGPISGDPGRLQQVIWNLLSNAIKFTARGGKVQVVLERVNSHIEISVADTGVGIQPEFIPYLFERFRQADASTTRRYGGLGLGLSIVKNLVELHGGTVSVSSAGEGLGTTVTVHLPVSVVYRHPDPGKRVHPKEPLERPARFMARELEGLTVAVVDDHPDARDLIKRVLEDSAATVVTASTAEEALLLVEERRPDVLVTDIGMPDADGFELLKRVRALGPERGGAVPAVALTAFARSEDRTRALRAGFLVHLSKPVGPSELVATVASVAGRANDRLR